MAFIRRNKMHQKLTEKKLDYLYQAWLESPHFEEGDDTSYATFIKDIESGDFQCAELDD
jgi:hypothetical protein